MTHHDDARLEDLVARMGAGDTKDLFRSLLLQGMQELIDTELTAAIGAELHERTEARTNQRNGASVPEVPVVARESRHLETSPPTQSDIWRAKCVPIRQQCCASEVDTCSSPRRSVEWTAQARSAGQLGT